MWVWLHSGGLQVGVEDGLIRRRDLAGFDELQGLLGSLRAEAERLADQARIDAEAMRHEAETAAEAIRRQAHGEADDIRRNAQEQGLAQGLAEAAERWHARRLEAQRQRTQELAAQQQVMASVVVTAVERIVRAEPARALFEQALTQVHDLLREASEARLCVHPGDVASAGEAVQTLPRRAGADVALRVVADASLAPGACRFESDLGVLDASLDLQLASLRRAIDGAQAKAQAETRDEVAPELDEVTL